GQGRNGRVVARPGGAIERRELRYDRERRPALPREDRGGLPSVHQQAQRTVRRTEQPVALADRQFVSEVGLEGVCQIERRERLLQKCPRIILHGVEPALVVVV